MSAPADRDGAAKSPGLSAGEGMRIMAPEYQYRMGFAAKADELGADVVGEPLTDELPTATGTRQVTTLGVLEWFSGPNVVHFFATARRAEGGPA